MENIREREVVQMKEKHRIKLEVDRVEVMQTNQPKSISINGVEIPTCQKIFETQIENNRRFEFDRAALCILFVAVFVESIALFVILTKL